MPQAHAGTFTYVQLRLANIRELLLLIHVLPSIDLRGGSLIRTLLPYIATNFEWSRHYIGIPRSKLLFP